MTGNKLTGIPRSFEMLIALAGLIAFLPLLAFVAALIKLTSRGPVLFRQKRVGRFGREFTLYKFRTMRVANQGLKVTAAGDRRITKVGKWLRKTKVDELPELWNVLVGEMSFVGPRPEVPEYVDLRNPLWQQILSCRPGITDPVTLRLRNEEKLLALVEDKEEFYETVLQPYKLRGYVWFITHKSWKTDIRIIGRTIAVVLLPQIAPPPTKEEMQIALAE